MARQGILQGVRGARMFEDVRLVIWPPFHPVHGCMALKARAGVDRPSAVARRLGAAPCLARPVHFVLAGRERSRKSAAFITPLRLVRLLEAQTEPMLVLFHLEDPNPDPLPYAQHFCRVHNPLVCQLRYVDQPLKAALKLDKGPKIRDVRNLRLYNVPDGIAIVDGLPGIGQQPLDGEPDMAILAVNAEHQHAHSVTDLEQSAGVSHTAPGDL